MTLVGGGGGRGGVGCQGTALRDGGRADRSVVKWLSLSLRLFSREMICRVFLSVSRVCLVECVVNPSLQRGRKEIDRVSLSLRLF